MTGRFLNFLGLVALYALVGALVGIAFYFAMRDTGPPRYEAASPSARHAAAFSAPETSERPSVPRLDQTPVGGGGVSTAGLGNPLPGSANPKVQVAMGSGLDPTGSGGASPPPSFPATCVEVCRVDVAEWDWETPEPVLRPLASDCRLPCYGTPRVGPASWYNAGSGYYAAIPGYLGGVVSVVVCSFPNGQANCHTFPVTTSCQCYRHEKRERVVDLSPAAYSLFAPLSTGLVMVQITVLR